MDNHFQAVLLPANPTPQALREIADSVGAAGFEELTVDALAQASGQNKKQLNTADGDVEYLNYQGLKKKPDANFIIIPQVC